MISAFLWLFAASASAAPPPRAPDAAAPVPVEENFARLLREFDVDGDSRITVDDRPSGAFALIDARGGTRAVRTCG